MTLTSAFLFSVLSGGLCGTVVGWARAARKDDSFPEAALLWVFGGAFSAALIFGAQIGFGAVLYFLLGPLSPSEMLEFTIVVLLLLGLAGLLA